jgi:DNA-binding transcriptional LysR family regulator
MPVGSAMRARYDELAATFPQPPATYPVLSHSLAMLWWLVLQQDLLLLLALQMARPRLDTGELVELPLPQRTPMRPLGILQPIAGMGEAAAAFSDFLRKFAPATPATPRPSRAS